MKTMLEMTYTHIQDVQAMQWLPDDNPPSTKTPADEMRDWLNAYEAQWHTKGVGKACVIFIHTPEGELECVQGDWIIMLAEPNMDSEGPDTDDDMFYYFRVVSQHLFINEYIKR